MTLHGRRTLGQLVRYAVVGAVSNLVLYGLFVLFVRSGMRPQMALTLLYAVGLAQTFVFHKQWTFGDRGLTGPPLRRYLLLHLACYSFNMGLLWVLVDQLRWPAEAVQFAATFIVAGLLFLGQKFWVFQPTAHTAAGTPP